jgi:Calcineurin-like phosphoesterase
MNRYTASLGVVLLAAATLIARPHASASPCEFETSDRIVAIGDVHGAYDRLVEILQTAELVDRSGRWSGARTHLVQLGDVLDRGPDSRKVLDLLQRLEREAASAGGSVHHLMGNHEVMRLLGDYRYVTPGEYEAFATVDSEGERRRFVQSAPADGREQLMRETPLGMVEMNRAFGPKAPYGSLLRSLNAVVRINGILFLHGGISPAVSALSCAAINDTVRRELSADLEKTREAPLVSLAAREDGPFWYRGWAQEPDAFEPSAEKILAAQHARAIVVAHTVMPDGRIHVRFSGRAFLIDTGMQPAYAPDGRASALEIRGDVVTAIYSDGREVLGRIAGNAR